MDMMLSELIKELTGIHEDKGDMPVFIGWCNHDFEHRMQPVRGIETRVISFGEDAGWSLQIQNWVE